LRGRDFPRHLGEPELDGLGRRERFAKHFARFRVVDQLRQAGLRRADHAPGDAVARLREAGQRTLESFHARQQVRFRHHDVVEEQRGCDRRAQGELAFDFRRVKTLHAFLDDEAPDAIVRHRPADAQVGDRAIGDPHLRAVDDPVAAFLLRVGLHVRRVGAAVRFGEAEAADLPAARHVRQPLLFLLVIAKGEYRVHAQRALHRDEAANSRVAAFEFLADESVADRVEAGAVVTLDGRP